MVKLRKDEVLHSGLTAHLLTSWSRPQPPETIMTLVRTIGDHPN